MPYTTSQATTARAIKVKIGSTYIAEICTDGVPIPQVEVDDVEVTNQDSGDWKEYLAGRKDGGECELKANAVDSDAGQIALKNAYVAGTAYLFTNEFTQSGSTQTFYAVVKTYDHIVEDDILKISCKLKVSGAPEFSSTASVLTALAATGETLVPDPFAAATLKYTTVIAAADTQIVVVPTQAAEGATITVDGTAVASGGNGTVTLGAAGTDIIKSIDIIVKELTKAATVYTLIVTRPKA